MSSSRPRPDSGSGPARTVQTGATTSTPTRKRRPWWLWALLALVALAVLLFSLAECGDNDIPSATAGSAASAVAPAPGGSAAADPITSIAGLPGAAAPDAALSADGTSLLPLAQAAGAGDVLTSQVGKAVTARGVLVQSVPADEGFWVGEDNTDRVWVQLSGSGESGYTVEQGDRVDFTGTMTAHEPAFAAQVGVDAAEGADQLTQEAAHVAVDKSTVALSLTAIIRRTR
jgi:hypothetical protein